MDVRDHAEWLPPALRAWRPRRVAAPARLEREGLTARDAAAATLAELETFLKSDESKHCRDCYVRDWEGRVRMAGPRTEDIPSHMSSRVRHPGKIAPEARIEYGD